MDTTEAPEPGNSTTSAGSVPTRATIDVRTLVLVTGVALALLAAYVVGTGRGGTAGVAAADTSSAAGTSNPATMMMIGTGKATGVPDEMTFQVAIRTNASDVSAALARASATATRILHRLRHEGVDPKDAKTTGLSVHPVYDYSRDGSAVISGYAASEDLAIAVTHLATAGRVLGVTADAGGNAVRISAIKLGIADQDALLRRARQDAVDEAISKARQYAAAAGRDLGQVVSIREVTPNSTIRPIPTTTEALRHGDFAAGTVVPIRHGGRSQLQVNVAVVWSFA